jgi:hypothetical protein
VAVARERTLTSATDRHGRRSRLVIRHRRRRCTVGCGGCRGDPKPCRRRFGSIRRRTRPARMPHIDDRPRTTRAQGVEGTLDRWRSIGRSSTAWSRYSKCRIKLSPALTTARFTICSFAAATAE